MRGNATCSFQREGIEDIHFENAVLTLVSDDQLAILAISDSNDPKELLTLECAHITILSGSHFELEGFAVREEQPETFIKCSVEFFPKIESEQEAA